MGACSSRDNTNNRNNSRSNTTNGQRLIATNNDNDNSTTTKKGNASTNEGDITVQPTLSSSSSAAAAAKASPCSPEIQQKQPQQRSSLIQNDHQSSPTNSNTHSNTRSNTNTNKNTNTDHTMNSTRTARAHDDSNSIERGNSAILTSAAATVVEPSAASSIPPVRILVQQVSMGIQDDDAAVIAAPAPTDDDDSNSQREYQKIPPADDESDESDYEYEYEDEDDAAFSGFLMESEHAKGLNTTNSQSSGTATNAAIVEEDIVSAADSPTSAGATAAFASSDSGVTDVTMEDAATAAASSSTTTSTKRKWREPTREAVNMSIRAQSESTGSKRRLAQDLYKIMNQDTEEAGFRLSPQSEDSMDRWKIQLFKFDEDSNLAKDMLVLGLKDVELEMTFPNQYPFEPPFVRVSRPRFKRQTGFVMNGALCMELLTKDGWNPVNDIESVIVSVRSLLVVGDGRLQAATDLSEARYNALLSAAAKQEASGNTTASRRPHVSGYSAAEAKSAYSHLSDYHKKKGWDVSGWWAKKG